MFKELIKKYNTFVDVLTTDIFETIEKVDLVPNLVISGVAKKMEPIAKLANWSVEEAENPINIQKLADNRDAEFIVKLANEREAIAKMAVLQNTPTEIVKKYDEDSTLLYFDYREESYDISEVLNHVGGLQNADYVAVFKFEPSIMNTVSSLLDEDCGVNAYIQKDGFYVTSLDSEEITKWNGKELVINSRVEKFDLAPFDTLSEVYSEFYKFFESLDSDQYIWIDEIGSDYIIVDWYVDGAGYLYYRIPFTSDSTSISLDADNIVEVEFYSGFRDKVAKSIKPVAEPESVKSFTISKIMKLDDSPERFVMGVVLEPNDGIDGELDPDAQGDYMGAEDIKKTAHGWLGKGGVMKIMHEDETTEIIPAESYIAQTDFTLGTDEIKKGSWILGAYIDNDDVWELVEKGDFTGWSVAGRGARITEE